MMSATSGASGAIGDARRDPWLPMIVIAMGQALMSFNVAALPVSMSGMVESFNTPPTTVGTAIVMYSLGVAGFIMLGGKLGQRFGSKIFFQGAVSLFLVALLLMVLSPNAYVMLLAQALAGLAGAGLVPTLVVLIANHYQGRQQAEAVGWLGSARAIAGVLAFVIVGFLAMISWRLAFGLLMVHAVMILILSFKLRPSVAKPEVKIDLFGVLLSAVAVILISFGFNNIRGWGLFLARDAAPFDLFGISPAPLMIVVGISIFIGFFAWTHRRSLVGKTPLLSLKVLDSPREWGAVVALFIIVAMEGAINFLVPLYIQIIQGQSSLATSVTMMPFMLTVFFVAILVVRLYDRFSPRAIASTAFVIVAAGAMWLAFVASNDWSVVPVILGLVTVGIGQGALVTLLFNVLVTAVPSSYAADVGALRGVTQNLAAAVGTALVGAMVVGFLAGAVIRQVDAAPAVQALVTESAVVDLTRINFISNENLEARFVATSAAPEVVEQAIRINTTARLRALQIGFFIISIVALFAIVPCRWLPAYKPSQIPPEKDLGS